MLLTLSSLSSLSNVKEKTLQLKNQVESIAKEGAETFKSVSSDVQNSFKEWKKDVEPTMTNIQKYPRNPRNY
ncbi:hypothetical protein KHA80_04880 [Anaerobacillus sp. HL2]|nr:hypothetical protein KHA80_04880 [Anaerobacillus sp. HL2]